MRNKIIKIGLVFYFANFFCHLAYSQSTNRQLNVEQTKDTLSPTIEDHAVFVKTENQQEENIKKADVIRVKTIKSISALLDSPKLNDNRKFELYLRLGELYVERHDYLRGIEVESFAHRYDKWVNDGAKGKEPQISHKESRQELLKGTNVFRKLVSKYSKHPRLDSVLLELGRNLSRLENDNAVLFYTQLLKTFPKSKLVPETYLALGEHYFDKHDIDNAIKYYKKTMDFKTSSVYPYSVYKLGWSFFNAKSKTQKDEQANLTKALAAFKLVIKLAEKSKSKKMLNLKQEAIKDMVLVWAEVEDVDGAWAYFKTIGEKDAFYNLLERLGNVYAEQGKTQKAIVLYDRLLKQSPNRKNAPQVHEKLVQLFATKGDDKELVKNLDAMSKIYTANGPWIKSQKEDIKELLERAEKLVEYNIYKYGATYHNAGIKSNRKDGFELAKLTYKIYLQTFPDHTNAYVIRYNLADIHYNLKEFDAAATQYMIVSQHKNEKKYQKDSAKNAIVAMSDMIEGIKYPKLPPPGEVAKPIDIPAEKKKLIRAMENHIVLLPKDPSTSTLKLNIANTHFNYGHYEDAIAKYQQLVNEEPKSKEADTATRVVINYYAKHKRWQNVVSFIGTNSKNKELLSNEKLAAFITGSLKHASFSYAMQEESAGKHEMAAISFLKYQKMFPTDENADKALFNASINFYKAGFVTKGADSLEKLINTYDRSELLANSYAKLAETYDGLGEVEKAANFYSLLGARFPQDKRSEVSLFNSAVIYFGLAKFDKAKVNYQFLLKNYPKSKFTNDTLLGLAEVEEKTNDYKSAIEHYRMAAKSMQSLEDKYWAEAQATKLEYNHGNRNLSEKDYGRLRTQLVGNQKVNAFEARRIVAQHYFNKLNQSFDEFLKMQVSGKQMEKKINDKQAKLSRLAKEYESIIEIGSPEYLVASLYQLGRLHENFSSTLFSAEVPKGTSAKETDQLKSTLEKLAFPLKEEAFKYFETAYKKSVAVQSFSPWTQKTYAKMSATDNVKYPKIDAITLDAGYQTHKMYLNDSLASIAE